MIGTVREMLFMYQYDLFTKVSICRDCEAKFQSCDIEPAANCSDPEPGKFTTWSCTYFHFKDCLHFNFYN